MQARPLPHAFGVELPPLALEIAARATAAGQVEFDTVQGRMRFLNSLAARCVEQRVAGPFAAGVFELERPRLVSVGVNQVVQSSCSLAHAEMLALALAQQSLGVYSLAPTPERPTRYELVTTCEPCAMCFGGVIWSGIERLVCGADAESAEAIGFDEGPKPEGWIAELERRGIEVVRGVESPGARAVLDAYARAGGPVYNAQPS